MEARLRWIRWGAVRNCRIEVCLWWIRSGAIRSRGIRCLQMCSRRFCFSSFQAMTCTKETRSTLSQKPSLLVCSRHFATGKKWTSSKAPGICRRSPNVLMGNKDLHKMNIYHHKMTGFVKWPLTIKGWDLCIKKWHTFNKTKGPSYNDLGLSNNGTLCIKKWGIIGKP